MTNGRASVDYACENGSLAYAPNYMMGISSMLFWAVNLPPSKDILWTTPHQVGSRIDGPLLVIKPCC